MFGLIGQSSNCNVVYCVADVTFESQAYHCVSLNVLMSLMISYSFNVTDHSLMLLSGLQRNQDKSEANRIKTVTWICDFHGIKLEKISNISAVNKET